MKLLGKLKTLSKDRLDYLNSILSAIKDLGLILIVAITFLYFLFPSFENFIRVYVQGESRYFYVGKWNSENKNFDAEKLYDLNKFDYDPESGLIKKDIVILATANPIVGRSDYGTESSLRKFTGKAGDCLLVLDSKSRALEPGYEAIWVRALPKVCK